MSTNDRTVSLLDIGREHFKACTALSVSSTTLNGPLKEASGRLSAECLRRASVGKREASELLYASVEAHVDGKTHGFYSDYIFNCSIFVASIEHGADELLTSMAGEAVASALEMMTLISLKSGDLAFITGAGGDMLDKIGDMLGVAFYKVFVRAFRVTAMLESRDSAVSKMDLLSSELDLESLRMEARELLPIARSQCRGDQQRTRMLEQFEAIL